MIDSSMFRKASLYTFGAFSLLAALWLYLFAYPHEADYTLCKALQNQKTTVSQSNLASTSHQNRKGVVKEIYFTQEDNTRLQYRIESESSLLTIIPNGTKLDLNEKLENIKCWMQDKIYYTPGKQPMQQIRFLEAKDGVYLYNSQQFLAQTVTLSLYRLSSHILPSVLKKQSPFLKGIAEDISFVVSGKTPQFQAHHFQALLNQDKPDTQ